MCKGRQRMAGILRKKQKARQRVQMYGQQGLVMVEYRGEKEGETDASVYTGIRYQYWPERRFYVDANDLSRLLVWRENGQDVFYRVDNGARS